MLSNSLMSGERKTDCFKDYMLCELGKYPGCQETFNACVTETFEKDLRTSNSKSLEVRNVNLGAGGVDEFRANHSNQRKITPSEVSFLKELFGVQPGKN